MSNYTVRKLKIGKSEQLDSLALAAGELYTRVLVSFWRTVNHKGIWLKKYTIQRWHKSYKMHSHSADAIVDNFYSSLSSWRVRRKTDPDARPPKRQVKYYKIQWKDSAIRLKNGMLILSNGKGNQLLQLLWQWDMPKLVEIGWNGQQYELRAIYLKPQPEPIKTGITVGIDLGEIHAAVAHTGSECFIVNGRVLRSKRQYQNKLKAVISSKIDVKKHGSNRRRKLACSKRKQYTKINNQIRDIMHKQTTKLVSVLKDRGAQTVVIGDVRDIRKSIKYGHKANQKLHQWVHGKIRYMITYKAEREGMQVVLQDEAYTSQTCPSCNSRYKPKGRNYACAQCGFEYHRDGVGSFNIRQKYLCKSTVVGRMACPIGLRYKPHSLCSSVAIHSSRKNPPDLSVG